MSMYTMWWVGLNQIFSGIITTTYGGYNATRKAPRARLSSGVKGIYGLESEVYDDGG